MDNSIDIYNPISLVGEKDKLLIAYACTDDAINKAKSILNDFDYDLQKDVWSKWNGLKNAIEPKNDESVACDDIEAVLQNINRIVQNRSRDILSVVIPTANALLDQSAQELESFFYATDDGKRLMQAWTALLDGDTDTLSRVVPYAKNELPPVAQRLFRGLVEATGIGFASSASSEFSAHEEGWVEAVFVFSMGSEGLRVSYDRHGWKAKPAYKAEVVHGTIAPELTFEESEPANEDSEAVKATATRIAQTVRDYYATKIS